MDNKPSYSFLFYYFFISVKLKPNFQSATSQKTINYRRNRLSAVMFSVTVWRSKSDDWGDPDQEGHTLVRPEPELCDIDDESEEEEGT